MPGSAPAASHVLVVDDDPCVNHMFQTLLANEGYRVASAADGRQALARVEADPPDLILLDVEMPHVTGHEVCRRLKQSPATRLIPIVLVTGRVDGQDRIDAWELGADEFLTKPFNAVEVLARCRSLLRIKRLVEERDSAEAVVFALARAVEAKSSYTHGHSERVREYALLLADAIGLSTQDRELLHKGALLHDIGKIRVPDAVLDKPGPLTAEEMGLVKQHPIQGAHIVEPLTSVRDAVPLIRWHHERRDGRGYPDGLHGEQIPLLVRVLAVADVFDALASERPYRPRLPFELCLQVLDEDSAGGGLDPTLVASFRKAVRQGASAPQVLSRPFVV